MSSVGQTLKLVREKMGYHSARSFYMALESRTDLQFNYSYYMKIEADQTSPSEKVINQLATLLPESDGDLLVAAYCQSLFPSQMRRLLPQESKAPVVKQKGAISSIKNFQQELTEKQVAVISQNQDIYFLFLILTLSRQGLSLKDLNTYDFKNLDSALDALIKAKIIFTENNLYYPTFPEFKFPKASSALAKLYDKLDSYDHIKQEFFQLRKAKLASFFKRASSRHIELLLSQLEVLFQTVRVSDETDSSYNNEVVSLNIQMYRGGMKG